MTDNVDNAPATIKQASANITIFLNQIKDADYDQTNTLQKRLDKALSSVSYTIDCFKKKITTLTYTHRECAKGKGTMERIFEFALDFYRPNDLGCTSETGHAYTSFEATKSYIEQRMVTENKQADCILNSEDMKTLVCSYYVRGYENADIERECGVTAAQVSYFVAICPPGEITPVLKTRLCLFKPFFNLQYAKDLYSRYNQQDLEDAFNSCSLPATMPDSVKQIICSKKKMGESKIAIRTAFNQWPTSTVDGAYNSCTEPKIPDDVRNNICDLRNKFDLSLFVIVNSYKQYPAAKVEETYKSC